MTPAIKLLQKSHVTYQIHEYQHSTDSQSYGLEAAEKLGIASDRVFKTLVIELSDNKLAVGVIPVISKLNMKNIAKALGAKKAEMADKQKVQRSTGYVLGGVSPLGQKKQLQTIVDSSAEHFSTIFVSAGRRGLEIELNPSDLVTLVNGRFSPIC